MMQGSLAWNWRTDILCFHLLFYLSALRSSITSSVTHSHKSGDSVLLFHLFSHVQLFPHHCTEGGRWLKQHSFMTPENLHVCIWKVESLWLKERDLRLTCYKNMSGRMGDKGVLGKDCQQNWISSQEDTTQAMVQWFTMSSQLFTTTTFQTLLCITLSLKQCVRLKHQNRPGLWRVYSSPPSVLNNGWTIWPKTFCTTNERVYHV